MKERSRSSRGLASSKRGASKKVAAPKKAVKRSYALRKPAKKANFVTRKVRPISPYLEVQNAAHVKGNVLIITFNNGVMREIDFSNFFKNNTKAYLNKYKQPAYFKRFKIEDGNLIWGRDWDLIFPIEQLYKGSIK